MVSNQINSNYESNINNRKTIREIKPSSLREQRITKEKLPVIDFTNTLKDNMVGVDDAALETKLVELEM